jgi:tetratricopeptide (TPR) repeat protein
VSTGFSLQFWLVTLASVCLTVPALAQQRQLTSEEAANLEIRLTRQPDDVDNRSRLLYHYAHNQLPDGLRREARRRHILWLIRNRPDAEILAEPFASLYPGTSPLSDPEGYGEAVKAWREQLAKPDPGSRVLMRAVSFFQATDRKLAYAAVQRGIRAFPQEKYFLQQKGMLDAFTVAGVRCAPLHGMFELDPDLASPGNTKQARQDLLESGEMQHLNGALAVLPQLYVAAHAKNTDLAADLFILTEKLAFHLKNLDNRLPTSGLALFMLYSSAASRERDPQEKLPLLEKALSNTLMSQQKFYVLGDLAETYLALGKQDKAVEAANRLLTMAGSMTYDWNYGNAIHQGNLVLGRIALSKGNVNEAKERLLAAGRTKGSPQLNSFGPKWELAQELLNRNERSAVLDYLSLCREFWKGHEETLDSWASAIRAGGNPRLERFGLSTSVLNEVGSALVGSMAPPFQLEDLQGVKRSLESYKGKVVLLDFWATWCAPCREEMPIFEKLHREMAGKDVAVLTVNVDEPKETVSRFIEEGKYTFPVLLSEGTDIPQKFAVNGYPTLVTVDKTGRIAQVLVGSRPEEQLRPTIEIARAGAPQQPVTARPDATAPQNPEDYYRSGVGLMQERKLAEAEAAFTHALEFRKGWIQALMMRAQIRYQLKTFDGAIADLNEVIRLKPNQASAYDKRGLAYSYSGRHQQAISDYTKATELEPDRANPYNNRGWAYLELGRREEALADLNRALELNPAYQLALENRLRLFMETKQYQQAIADGQSVLRLNRNATWASERIAEARRLMDGREPLLPAPALISPKEGAVFDHYPRHTVLQWAPITGAAAYEVETDYFGGGKWASELNGQPILFRVIEPEYPFDFVGAQPGRWRVRAVSPDGQVGVYSNWRTFRYTR